MRSLAPGGSRRHLLCKLMVPPQNLTSEQEDSKAGVLHLCQEQGLPE